MIRADYSGFFEADQVGVVGAVWIRGFAEPPGRRIAQAGCVGLAIEVKSERVQFVAQSGSPALVGPERVPIVGFQMWLSCRIIGSRATPVPPGLRIPHHHPMKIPPVFPGIASRIVLLGSLGLVSLSQAATLHFGQAFSDGAVPPGGKPPWMTVTTSNHSTGVVLLEIEATQLINHEFVSEWVMNLDPELDPARLVFSSPAQTGSFVLPTIQTGTDRFKADGDGWYDIQFQFSTSDNEPDALRFTSGDKLSYLVTLAGGEPGVLDENSFHVLSRPGGGSGPFYTAAHIQATGYCCGGSAWIANVPEPCSTLLGGFGLLVLLRRRRG